VARLKSSPPCDEARTLKGLEEERDGSSLKGGKGEKSLSAESGNHFTGELTKRARSREKRVAKGGMAKTYYLEKVRRLPSVSFEAEGRTFEGYGAEL